MPNFTYTNNIPLASHNPSFDQPDMQINTNSIESIIEVDHFSFNDDDGGYHKKVSLVDNAGPFPTPAGVGSVIYSGATNNLVFTNASLAGAGIQMTIASKPPADVANGSSFLPGGILIQWGSGSTVAGSITQAYNYAFSQIFSINVSIGSLGAANRLISANPTNLTQITVYTTDLNSQPTANQVYWTVIGLPA